MNQLNETFEIETVQSEPTRVRRFCGDRGAGEMFLIILMTSLIGFAGLAYDAGMAFNARREAVGVAGAAARAGADEVDETWLYLTGQPSLDAGEATSAARNFALNHGADTAQASVPGTAPFQFQIQVRVTKTHNTQFLRLFGVSQFQVEGRATANVESNYQ